MKDLLKRTILKTLREFDNLNVFPTLEDVYFSLDTSEAKKSFKRDIFDESIEDLIASEEIFISRADDLFFVSSNLIPPGFALEILEYRKNYRKEIKKFTTQIGILKSLPFLLNISTLNLIPLKPNKDKQIYIFVKNNSAKLTMFLLKIRFFFDKKKLNTIEVIEYSESQRCFPQRKVQSAYKLANMHPIINKNNFYEGLIYENKWVFEILGNFPVSRISLNYRGTSNKKEFNSSFITKFFNRFL